MMSNIVISKLNNKLNSELNYVCYSLFSTHVRKFEEINVEKDFFLYLEPSNLTELINKSLNLQIDLLMKFKMSKVNNRLTGLSKVKYRKEILSILKENFSSSSEQLRIFETKLTLFRTNLRKLREESDDKKSSQKMFGGMIGSFIAGPLGALGGMLLAGNGKNSVDDELELELDSLMKFYQSLINGIESSFAMCFEDCNEMISEFLTS